MAKVMFKEGDRVKIVRSDINCRFGWNEMMSKMVGKDKIYTIRNGDERNDGVSLKDVPYTWPSTCLALVETDKISVVYKVGSMEFDTNDAAVDHLQRISLDEFIKGCGGEEKFVNYIMKNKTRMIEILTKEYK